MAQRSKKGDIVRNICIMAHVDHGKTTLADALIACNGFISQNQAGSIRYMDSRPDEMERGITMKSSCITLFYENEEANSKGYMINLIDSPGHVDFSSEVSTAVRLCDGYILVVDVVEGVCAQTKAVMRQAWVTGLKPVLVLNKLDRLIREKSYKPIDAYYQIALVLEQVNAYIGELYNANKLNEDHENAPDDDSELYFNPASGNVIFASSIDGWGFTIAKFAESLSPRTGISRNELCECLWGDYYLSSKAGKRTILKGARDKNKTPLFVYGILDNIYKVYSDVYPATADKNRIQELANSLGISMPIDVFRSQNKERFRHFCSQWLPLSKAVMSGVVAHLPPPTHMSEGRAKLLLSTATQDFGCLPEACKSLLLPSLLCCSSDASSPLVIFISKMFGIPRKDLDEADEELEIKLRGGHRGDFNRQRLSNLAALASDAAGTHKSEEAEELIALARVFSGTLKPGQEVYVIGPKHSPASVVPYLADDGSLPDEALVHCAFIEKCKVSSVYLLQGRKIESRQAVMAGMIVGIRGLSGRVLKSGSLSTTPLCPPFTHVINTGSTSVVSAVPLPNMAISVGDNSEPIMRVAVVPRNLACLEKLRSGLRLLNHADPCVQVWLETTGEYFVGAAGEVHLQRCVSDLEERYACTPLYVSPPIVPFKETIVAPPAVDNTKEVIEGVNVDTRQNVREEHTVLRGPFGSLRLRAVPLPASITEFLYRNGQMVSKLTHPNKTSKVTVTMPRVHSVGKENQTNSDETCQNKDKNASQVPSKNLSLVFNESNANSSSLSTKETMGYMIKNTSQSQDTTEHNEFSKVLQTLKSKLREVFSGAGDVWEGSEEHLWSLGPRNIGCNILLNKISKADLLQSAESADSPLLDVFENMKHTVIMGFQQVTAAGPLCKEPLMGVCFVADEWIPPTADHEAIQHAKAISLAKEAFIRALELQPLRLVIAMYSCTVELNSSSFMGQVYRVLHKRNARILQDDVAESSSRWTVSAHLPIVESIDFTNELRKMSSGEAQPQLTFSHWEVLETDPYWEPCTTEELKHYGDKADSDNLALKYMNEVRRRKGLKEHAKKFIEHGEKQRTLKMNK